MTRQFLGAWARAIGGGVVFMVAVFALLGVAFVIAAPALFLGAWGVAATIALVFLLITALVALEDL